MQHKQHFLPCKDRGSVPNNLSSKENPRTALKVFTKLNLNIVFFQKEVTHTKIIRMDIVFNHLWEPFARGKKHGFLGRLKRQKKKCPRNVTTKDYMLEVFESNNALTI